MERAQPCMPDCWHLRTSPSTPTPASQSSTRLLKTWESVWKSDNSVCYQNVWSRPVCPPQIVLLFPGPDAMTVEELWEHFSADTCGGEPRPKRLKVNEQSDGAETHICPVHRVIFIDSTWNQTTRIITDERLQGTDRKNIQNSDSTFLMMTRMTKRRSKLF